MDRAEAVREMTFEEEAVLYQQEAKAIFAKEDTSCEAPPINHTVRRGMRIIRKAREEIAALREQEPKGVEIDTVKNEWISVKERLPEDDPRVKKHIEGENFGFLTVLVYNGVVKQTNRFFCNAPQFGLPKTNGWEWASTNVTHWMPLPEPPKEGAEG